MCLNYYLANLLNDKICEEVTFKMLSSTNLGKNSAMEGGALCSNLTFSFHHSLKLSVPRPGIPTVGTAMAPNIPIAGQADVRELLSQFLFNSVNNIK